jgi:hypothetical protein
VTPDSGHPWLENAETIYLFSQICAAAERIQEARTRAVAPLATCQWPCPVILSIPRSQHLTVVASNFGNHFAGRTLFLLSSLVDDALRHLMWRWTPGPDISDAGE